MQTLQPANKMWKNNAEKRDANAIYTFVKLFLQLNPLCNLHKKCKLFCKIGINSEVFARSGFFWHFSGFDALKSNKTVCLPTEGCLTLRRRHRKERKAVSETKRKNVFHLSEQYRICKENKTNTRRKSLIKDSMFL